MAQFQSKQNDHEVEKKNESKKNEKKESGKKGTNNEGKEHCKDRIVIILKEQDEIAVEVTRIESKKRMLVTESKSLNKDIQKHTKSLQALKLQVDSTPNLHPKDTKDGGKVSGKDGKTKGTEEVTEEERKIAHCQEVVLMAREDSRY